VSPSDQIECSPAGSRTRADGLRARCDGIFIFPQASLFRRNEKMKNYIWHTGTFVMAMGVAICNLTASAAELFLVPEEHPGPPIYARELDEDHNEWVVYVFYRPLDCVPKNFNLIDFFDFDLLDPPEECEILMEGFEIWEEPFIGPPFHQELHDVEGKPIPILFVKRTEWLQGIANGRLTLTELLKMKTLLIGTADSYHEILQPADSSAKVPQLNIITSGTLEDGRSFDVFVELNEGDFLFLQVVNIE
jgi:hypothetical protein